MWRVNLMLSNGAEVIGVRIRLIIRDAIS